VRSHLGDKRAERGLPLWECRGCGWSPADGDPPPERCPKCDGFAFTYHGATVGADTIQDLKDAGVDLTRVARHTGRPVMAKRCRNPDNNPNCAGTVAESSRTGLCRSCAIRRGKNAKAQPAATPAIPARTDPPPAAPPARRIEGGTDAARSALDTLVGAADAGMTVDATLHVEPGRIHLDVVIQAAP